MPTYEYECGACHHQFEVFQAMSEAPVKKCPACGKMKVERMIAGGAGIIFKGSGFYETDYKHNSGKITKESAAPESKSSASTKKAS